jgi:anti-sigma B factor antagonist
MMSKPPFRVELLRPSDYVAVVVLEGEVDMYSSRQFKEALLQGISGGATRIIVDLAKVTFIDSTALGVMVSGLRVVATQDGTLDIICRDENVKYIFEITKLNRIMHVYGSRDEALAIPSGTRP